MHIKNAPPPPFCFCPLLKISLVNPYLKILYLTKLFVADAPMKKIKEFSFTFSQSTLKYGSKNLPWPKGLKLTALHLLKLLSLYAKFFPQHSFFYPYNSLLYFRPFFLYTFILACNRLENCLH